MCCFTQHYELVYYNTQLATILGTNGIKLILLVKITGKILKMRS